MRAFIDLSTPCQDGFSIAVERIGMSMQSRINVKRIVALRKKEEEHLAQCSICNPELLANLLFGREVVIRDVITGP